MKTREVVLTDKTLDEICFKNKWNKGNFEFVDEIECRLGGRNVPIPLSTLKRQARDELEEKLHNMHCNLGVEYATWIDKKSREVTAYTQAYRYVQFDKNKVYEE